MRAFGPKQLFKPLAMPSCQILWPGQTSREEKAAVRLATGRLEQTVNLHPIKNPNRLRVAKAQKMMVYGGLIYHSPNLFLWRPVV